MRYNKRTDALPSAQLAVSRPITDLPFFRQHTYDPTLPRPRWYPKISPYRFIVFSTPLAIGTTKAVLSYKGGVTTPITLEWISGVVILLV